MSLLYGQDIAGEVLDEKSREPLDDVNIYLTTNSNIGTTSDEFGKFNLQLKSKFVETDSVSFSMVGYTTYKTTLSSLKDKSNIIYLSSALNTLNQVQLKSEKKQSKIKYSKLTSLGTGIYSFASIIVGNKLYISGGDQTNLEDSFREAIEKAKAGTLKISFEDIQRKWQSDGTYIGLSDKLMVYNIEENTWVKSNVKFENRAYHQINYYKNKLYILGGKKLSNFNKTEYLHNKIEIFDINNAAVQVDHTNPHQAINFASFVYKDNIITMGGAVKLDKNGDKVFTNKIHLFNLKTGLWYELGKLKQPKEVSGVLIGDKIYTIGGYNNQSMSSIESWDVNTGVWVLEGELFYAFDKPALASRGNNIYIYHYGKLLIYNIVEKSLKEYPIELYLKSSNMHIHKDTLYIIGGYKETEHSKQSTSGVYSIDLLEFSKTKTNNKKQF